MFRRLSAALATLALAGTAPAFAQPDPKIPMTQRTDKVGIEGRRGESLFRPGFGLGEFTGSMSGKSSSVRGFGVIKRDNMQASFTVSSPGMTEPVTVDCAGREVLSRLLWITFERDDLYYVCNFISGGKPMEAGFTLAASRGGWFSRLTQQPQRAGEMTYGGMTLRAEIKRVGGMPIPMNGVMGYVFSRDGVEIGGIDLNGFRPTAYLPPAGSPDREAAAVLALTLLFFKDPAREQPR